MLSGTNTVCSDRLLAAVTRGNRCTKQEYSLTSLCLPGGAAAWEGLWSPLRSHSSLEFVLKVGDLWKQPCGVYLKSFRLVILATQYCLKLPLLFQG